MFSWNWKTAAFSASCRAVLFALAVLRSGRSSALKAMCVELLLAGVLAGFQGAFTERMRRLEPPWRATLVCATGIALINHPFEFLVHILAGTPHTGRGIALSFLYTLCATRISLHLMRQGLFLTGPGGRAFSDDLRALPWAMLRGLIYRSTEPEHIKH